MQDVRHPGGEAKLPPHAPLTDYYRDEAARRDYLQRIFDDTAADYDRVERAMAFGSGPWYRAQALRRAGLAPGMDVLDVGIGTGLVARQALALQAGKGTLVGVDPSPGMMGEVHLPGVELREGRAEKLPCADASCDFLSMGYALRHVDDVAAAFAEFHRALRPGGRLMVLEITAPRGRFGRLVLKGYMRGLVPLIARFAARRPPTPELWRYYWDTIEACIAPPQVVAALEQAGFTQVARRVELGIFSEYTATRPA